MYSTMGINEVTPRHRDWSASIDLAKTYLVVIEFVYTPYTICSINAASGVGGACSIGPYSIVNTPK